MKRNENKKSLTKKIVAGTGLALLLALVGYTGANTYAKYISSATTESQTATVAKWGYVVTADTDALFGPKYNAAGAKAEDGKAVVKADTTSNPNLVAPGTQGSFSFTIKGQPEVASKITFDSIGEVKDVSLAHSGSETYYPVVWTIAVTNGAEATTSLTIPTELQKTEYTTTEMIAALNGMDVSSIAANQKVDCTILVSWEWVFHVNEDTDKLDTILGNFNAGIATEGYTCNTTLAFELKVSVEQIQA